MLIETQRNPSPRFTGLFIPAEILSHPELTLLEQMLLAWIDALYCPEHRGCFAKNEWFAAKLRVKENTIAKAICSLRSKGLIEDVSFDGRNRVIRARIGRYVEKCQSNAALDPMQPWIPVQPCIGFKSNPALEENPNPSYSYIQEDSKDYTPPIPPHAPPPEKQEAAAQPLPAKAGEDDVFSSLAKEKKPKVVISAECRELGEQMLDAMRAIKPDCAIPKNLTPFLTHLDFLLRLDNRTASKILEVFRWALADSFWSDKMFKPNPAKYLREKFDQLDQKMHAPAERKPRKFAPDSDDERAIATMKEMAGRAL